MAFTTRSEKKLSLSVAGTPSHLGPGSYNVTPVQHSGRLSAAPFGTTTTRSLHQNTQIGVGPGSYNIPSALQVAPPKGGGSSAFKTVARQFDVTSKAQSPGPGSYSPTPVPQRKDFHRKTQGALPSITAARKVRYEVYSSPPSIPVAQQSYGYQDSPEGILVPHPAPNRDATLGPAYYSPPPRKHIPGGAVFGRSKTKRMAFNTKAADGPAPGSYNTDTTLSVMNSRASAKPSAAFRSRSGRYFDKFMRDAQKMPGPGSYDLPNDSLNKKTFNVTYDM